MKKLSGIVTMLTIVSLIVLWTFSTTIAATPNEVNAATEKRIKWLATQQSPDGSWGTWTKVAETVLAVLKFETHAINMGMSPFNPEYEYSEQVESN